MTLLTKMTTPLKLNSVEIVDYKIIHLTHSENNDLNILSENHLKYSPGLISYKGKSLHDTLLDLIDTHALKCVELCPAGF